MPDDQDGGAFAGGADDWPRWSEQAGAAEPPQQEPAPARPDYGAEDYLRLPEFGLNYYSLEDAALLSALDMWSADQAPGVPAEGLPMTDEDDEPHDHQDDPLIRAALDPLRAQLLAALVRSAEAGQLDVEVRARTMADSRLIPARTFVHLPDLVEWLEVHGHDRADIIADIEESARDEPWLIAHEVAEDRARLRLGHLEGRHRAGTPGADADQLRAELRQQRLHIAQLEQQIDEAQRGGRTADKPVKARERRTLLVVIAALCKRAGIDAAARGAAMEIASATAEVGVPVSDDTIRPILKAMPDALG